MALLRERTPRPATRDLSRGEWLGIIGLGSATIAWVYALSRPAPLTMNDINVSCPPCDCTAPEQGGVLLTRR